MHPILISILFFNRISIIKQYIKQKNKVLEALEKLIELKTKYYKTIYAL